jgi:uncharacterized damage-inducible protein DinB
MPSSATEQRDFVRAIVTILDRDLQTVRREVEAYAEEGELWREVPGISNVGGTLVLHLAGNIQHYFGTMLGGGEYQRNRPAEFARRDVPRAELLQEIAAARGAIEAALRVISDDDLQADFPEIITGCRIRTSEYLIHLATHFAYHLGQLDYHRRVVTGDNIGVNAMRPADLSSARPVGEQANG